MTLLHDLVSIYSPSHQERPAVEHLTGWLAGHGFEATVDAAGNAVGFKGRPDAPNLLILLGHIDTFPGEIPVRIEGDLLYGRGSVDAKGSLCAFAEGAAAASVPANWRVMVVGAVEEEAATSKGARHICAHFSPQMCLIGEPSGAQRVTLGYKGRLVADYTLTRPEAHSARPEPTAGALGVALWNRVTAWAEAHNADRPKFFDQVMPGLRAINTHSDGFQEQLNMTLGFRLPPGTGPQAIQAALSEMEQAGGTFHFYGAEEAYQADKNTSLVRGLLAAIRAQGQQPGFVLKTGTSDMNVVGAVWGCPIAAYGPGDSSLDHTPDEHISLAEYGLSIAVIKHFIETLT